MTITLTHSLPYLLLLGVGVRVQVRAADRGNDLSHAIVPLPNWDMLVPLWLQFRCPYPFMPALVTCQIACHFPGQLLLDLQ